MKTIEVSRENWAKLCAQLNSEANGSLISIQRVESNGSTVEIATGVQLRQVTLDATSDPCNDTLIIEAGEGDRKPVRHVIVEPIHVRLKNGANDRYNRLEIQAEDGVTLISLNPGLKPLPAEETSKGGTSKKV